ncbi:hypothetical protein LJC57_04430 [Parabacteroides sp. OttesenSCG-928-G07]|nr:hypothetical protein [Parabacteroides sp. OttesenSCG-928-G21]MDL2277820.1 hypothetical protein [Parabacteroides sp. OttesenSCG-928-G07]
MRILGIIIVYFPDSNLKFNINSYLPYIDKLIFWENSPEEKAEYIPQSSKLEKMGLNRNVGIGKALNEAVNYAIENGYTHLLTMDQDSYFESNKFKTYLEIIEKTNQEIIYSPNYKIYGKEMYDPTEASLIEVEANMTSGSIYPISIFNKIGLFRDDFFIDSIDLEFCMRARKNNIPTKIVPLVNLVHKVGYQKKKYRFLWKTFFPNEYSPIRSYYIVRNGIITMRLYPWANWKGFLFYWFYKRLFFVLCYEKEKYMKCKGLIIGYLHGKRGVTGEQKIFLDNE